MQFLKEKSISDQNIELDHYLGFGLAELENLGGSLTAKEITQQPDLWQETWKLVKERKAELLAFLNDALQNESLTVILTGAGSSAFIGNVLQGPLQHYTKRQTIAIATTDLISHPEQYFRKTGTLLVSFARSGESPESLAAVKLANSYCEKIHHLIITCNPSGKLAMDQNINPTFVFLLSPAADDQGLAMTGSFTSMLLAGLLIARINEIDDLKAQVEQLAGYGRTILTKYSARLKEIAKITFERAIFLGSGPLKSAANESDLKLQELTDGKVICKYDSFLGFRHGPKAIINPATLLVYLVSNVDYVQQYEKDLIKDINSGEKGIFRMGIMETAQDDIELDFVITLSENGKKIDEEFLAVCSVVPAQILGFYKSIEFGLSPDKPSENETITRIVKGVTIYPIPEKK